MIAMLRPYNHDYYVVIRQLNPPLPYSPISDKIGLCPVEIVGNRYWRLTARTPRIVCVNILCEEPSIDAMLFIGLTNCLPSQVIMR